MARPRSDDKRSAILRAATDLIAQRGLAATPTSAISRRAKVAEGTLFTYFKTKDELVNALYRNIKKDLAGMLMLGYPSGDDLELRIRHVWDRYVMWGAKHPRLCKVLTQLENSGRLSSESIAAARAPFDEIDATAKHAVAARKLQNIPLPFMAALLKSSAETTINFVVADPRHSMKYRKAGFESFWRGIASH